MAVIFATVFTSLLYICYCFCLARINSWIFFILKLKKKKEKILEPLIISKWFVPTANWQLLMSAGESGWYQEQNIRSSLASLWKSREVPKITD